jgi:ATP-dependent Lon protease
MDIIEPPGYMLEEKMNIGQRHLLPKVLQEHGLTPEQLKIPQTVMKRIITDYTREAGVRNLDRQLAMICRRVARRVLENSETHIRLTGNNLAQYLGVPHYNSAPPTLRTQIGVAMGLGVTEMGGILLPVEVVTMVGKGDLMITGQLGDVMRESVIAALSYIRTRAHDLHIDSSFQDGLDLHIHLPENAMPKDGPSAGITIAIALISALTQRPIKTDLAMTGEVTLLGSVLAIGGLREKVLGAQQANIHNLIIPAANKKEMADIPTKIRQKMHFTLVENMDQVIDAALMSAPTIPEIDESDIARQADLSHNSHPDNHVAAQRERTSHHNTEHADSQDQNDEIDLDDSTFLISQEHEQNEYPTVRGQEATE